jgi:hypothetical protein
MRDMKGDMPRCGSCRRLDCVATQLFQALRSL